MIDGRRLDAEKIKEINVDINDYPKIDINVRDLTKIFNDINGLIKGLLIPNADVSSVKITYCYDLPNIMHFVGLKEINITAKSSVLSGSGCKNNIHNRSSK
jgi:hypothetical protein